MVLNEEQWIKELREKRIAYGISQGRLAVASGITREYLNKIESGKMKPSKELLETLYKELARFNPEAPLTMLFDYVKIRFPTLDIQHIIKDILKLNINYMLHEDYGHYSYTEHYSLGLHILSGRLHGTSDYFLHKCRRGLHTNQRYR